MPKVTAHATADKSADADSVRAEFRKRSEATGSDGEVISWDDYDRIAASAANKHLHVLAAILDFTADWIGCFHNEHRDGERRHPQCGCDWCQLHTSSLDVHDDLAAIAWQLRQAESVLYSELYGPDRVKVPDGLDIVEHARWLAIKIAALYPDADEPDVVKSR